MKSFLKGITQWCDGKDTLLFCGGAHEAYRFCGDDIHFRKDDGFVDVNVVVFVNEINNSLLLTLEERELT